MLSSDRLLARRAVFHLCPRPSRRPVRLPRLAASSPGKRVGTGGERRFLRHLRDNTWRPMPATGDAEVDPQVALQSLSAEWGFRVEPEQTASLLQFAELLVRWNQSINLTGAKSVGAVIVEHYPDAHALAKRLDRSARLIDVGSGGGLPALPLALLRPGLVIRLCEPIAKKAAFLRTAIRELKLAERVALETRRGEELADELADDTSRRFDVAIFSCDVRAGGLACPRTAAGPSRRSGFRPDGPRDRHRRGDRHLRRRQAGADRGSDRDAALMFHVEHREAAVDRPGRSRASVSRGTPAPRS